MRKFLIIVFVSALAAVSISCNTKAEKNDLPLVVQDVLNDDHGATITFRNSDRTISVNYRPSVKSGEVLLVKPDDTYVIMTENNHLDFIIILMLVIFAFLGGCLTAGRYVRRCLQDEEFNTPEEWGKTSDSYFG